MNNILQKRFNRGFYVILSVFTFTYAVGFFFLLLSWLGLQGFDPSRWQHNALPFYALVFLIGTISLFGIWKWKKWGVYGLAGAWVLTGILNLVFIPPTPIPYKQTFFAMLLVIAFFLLLLSDWQKLE
jgi:hypothetical protein